MRWWKILGLAGFAGVAATGVVIARSERRRRAYTPAEIRERLHARLDEASPAGRPPDDPGPLCRGMNEMRNGWAAAIVRGVCGLALGLAVALTGCTSSLSHLPAASPSRAPATPAHRASPPPATPAAGPGGGLSPSQLQAAYNVGPLLRRGIDGRGQTIVIVDPFGSPTIERDLAVFDRQFRLPPLSLRVIQPAGPVRPYRPTNNRTGAASETTLDVEWAHVMAPGASILLVETPTAEIEGRTGFPQIVQAEKYVIRHHLGGVISQSFGATEATFASRAALVSLRGAYQLAALPAYRVTVLAASGDNGAASQTYTTQSFFKTPQVGWPASDPLVTAVGGTQLDLAPDGTRLGPDVAWNDSGGGRSIVFARPAYQDGVSSVVGPRRGIPDISMDASCDSGVDIYSSYPGGPPGWSEICGTSLATPLFAGVVALADQVAGHPLGLINPALYRMAASHAPGIVDVVNGNNTFSFPKDGKTYVVPGFSARPGYDLVTGVGTVNAAQFVPELAKLAG